MLLPFMYSIRDAVLDLLGIVLYSQIPESALLKMQNFYIVDIQGIAVWTLIFLIVGLIIG